MSNSLRPHELQHARPPCPSPTPGVHSNSRPLWLNGPPLLFFAITRRLCHSAQQNIHFSSLGAPKQLGRHLAFVSSFLETCQVELSCLLEQWWRHSVLLQGPELGFERCETAEHYLNALPKEYKIRQNSPSVDARSKTSIPVTTVAWKFLSWLSDISSSFHCVELENLCVSLMSGSLGIFK